VVRYKRTFAVLLVVLMLLPFAACTQNTPTPTAFNPGAYSATVAGRNGDVEVTVEFSESEILSVAVGEHQETAGVADAALSMIPENILTYQSIGVDTIAGATITSQAIINAVKECITKAGGNPDDWSQAVTLQAGEDEEYTSDVLVLGGGGAGLAAAASAGEAGASVILLEKAASLGGNTILSGGIFNTADPELQQAEEMTESTRAELLTYLEYDAADFDEFGPILTKLQTQIQEYVDAGSTYLFDSPELHIIQTYLGSKREALDGTVITANLELLETLCYTALDSWHWLEEIGTPTRDALTIGVGALWKRTHHVDVPASGAKPLIDSLEAKALAEGVDIHKLTEAKELIVEDGRVVGVIAYRHDGTKVTYKANKGVVIATGGFAGNPKMVAEYNTYWPNLTADAPTDNTTTATGDGIVMAQAIGANTVGMGFTQLLPTCAAVDGEAGKGVGSQLYVNKEGLRYVNETSERDVLVKAAQEQTDGIFYGVGDAKMYNHPQQGAEKLADSVSKGYVHIADTLEEVAKLAGIDAEQFVKTVEAFNTYVENEHDPDFGRYGFIGKVEEPPFIIAVMSPALHHTMGGLEINAQTEVLNTSGEVIPGLYAAGEVCGGIHAGNRLGGNAIADIIVFGRIAGKNAAK
jgi:urocanate reductase